MSAKVNEQISSAISKVEGKNRYYIFFGVLIFVILIDYFFLMRPQFGALAKINPKIKELSENIERAEADIQRLNTYRASLEEASSKFTEANLRIKSKDEVSFILEYIAQVATRTGLKIDQIMPESMGQELLTENAQRKYFDIPIYMEARSSYHDFGTFLAEIEKNDLSLRVGGFSVVGTNDTKLHVVKITFKATIFEEVIASEG